MASAHTNGAAGQTTAYQENTDNSAAPRLLIIGLGLMGSSLAAALQARAYPGKIDGLVRKVEAQQQALASGWFERVALINTAVSNEKLSNERFSASHGAAAELINQADIIVLATPLSGFAQLLRFVQPYLLATTVITDVGSVKSCVRDDVVQIFGSMLPNFVLGHPIAGSERSGLAAADADLYQQQTVILTPTPQTSPAAVQLIHQLWQQAGARVIEMDVLLHDQILAATSHLPHLLAFTLVHSLAGADQSPQIFEYAAGGFRDFTRIAASDPVMWRDIFCANRKAIRQIAERFRQDLDSILRQLDDESEADATDSVAPLLTKLTQAKLAREHFSKILQTRKQAPALDSVLSKK